MVLGFERAQAEYESKMMCPYDYEETEEEENENESAYWAMVDSQMEDARLGD